MKLLRLLDLDHHELRTKCNTLESEKNYYKELFESKIVEEFFEILREKDKIKSQEKYVVRLKERIKKYKKENEKLRKNKNKGGKK